MARSNAAKKAPSRPAKPAEPPILKDRRLDLLKASARDWLTALERASALGMFDRGTGRKSSRTGREIAQDVASRWQVGQELHLRNAYLAGHYHMEHLAATRDERPRGAAPRKATPWQAKEGW